MSNAAEAPRRSWFWIQGATAGVAAAAVPGVALTLGVLLCPAILFYVSEKGDGHPVSRAMLLCGSIAIMHPVHTLWDHGGSLATALDLLADPTCPIWAWVACGAGWLLCEIAHIATRLASQVTTRQTTQSLARERDQLVAEWTADAGS